MRGVGENGQLVERDGGEGREAVDLLADLDVATLRRFVILVMKGGGVRFDRIAEVMRCSRSSLYRDAGPTVIESDPDN